MACVWDVEEFMCAFSTQFSIKMDRVYPTFLLYVLSYRFARILHMLAENPCYSNGIYFFILHSAL